MDYSLHQRGRASIDFLTDLRNLSDRLEPRTDARAGFNPDELPVEPEALQKQVTPVLESDPEFRVLRMCRDWTLEQKDRWWLENVYKGNMPQLTLRTRKAIPRRTSMPAYLI